MEFELTSIIEYNTLTMWVSAKPAFINLVDNHDRGFVKVCLLSLCTYILLLLFFCTFSVGDKLSVTGSSTILNQLVAGPIMVRHIKSISDPSLPLRVYGPIRLTHRHSQNVSTISFGGSFPYFSITQLLISNGTSYWKLILVLVA